MVRRDGAEVRKERISELGRLVLKALNTSGKLSLHKTVALAQYEFGLTKDRIVEYLSILDDLGRFVLDKEKETITAVGEVRENGGSSP